MNMMLLARTFILLAEGTKLSEKIVVTPVEGIMMLEKVIVASAEGINMLEKGVEASADCGGGGFRGFNLVGSVKSS